MLDRDIVSKVRKRETLTTNFRYKTISDIYIDTRTRLLYFVLRAFVSRVRKRSENEGKDVFLMQLAARVRALKLLPKDTRG